MINNSGDIVLNPLSQDCRPSVSVAMGTYNGSRFLGEQLYSLASQELLPCELVICDDGSKDETAQVIADFARTAPFEVRFIQNPACLGIAKNFEKAIMLCRGDIIAICDQDDFWNPQKLARCVESLEADPTLGGVFSDAELIDHDSAPLGQRLWASVPFRPAKDRLSSAEFVRLLLKQNVATAPTIVFRSPWRDTIVPIPTTWMQDAWIMWMLALYSSVGFVREPLVRYRVHPNQQIGVAAKTPMARFRKAHRAGNAAYGDLALRFEDLREKMLAHPIPTQAQYLRDLERRIHLLNLQARLPDSRIKRAVQMIPALPSYMRYTRGLVTICRDLLV
jgi:glycosyltransferase involved in cell wall biosynthesis